MPTAAGQGAGLFEVCTDAVAAADRLLHLAKVAVKTAVTGAGGPDTAQAAVHGLAWLATYVEALRQMLGWARRLEASHRFGENERLLLTCAFAEYLAQIAGGIPMSQNETVRLAELGVARVEGHRFEQQVGRLIDEGTVIAA